MDKTYLIIEPNNSDGFGAANGWHVNINPENIIKGIDAGFNEVKLTKATYMHEIGHNLGLDHNDKTKIMQNAIIIENNQLGNNTVVYNYPNMDKKAVQIMINRINRPRNNSLGVLIKK